MNKKVIICIAVAALFAGLALGLNVGHNVIDELPAIVTVGCLGVMIAFGAIASGIGKKEKTK